MQPGEERLLVIVQLDTDRFLKQDRAGVERLVDEMDRDAGRLHASGQCVAHGVRAGKGRQERGMDVHDAAAESGQRSRPDETHVARQQHYLGSRMAKRRLESPIEDIRVA